LREAELSAGTWQLRQLLAALTRFLQRWFSVGFLQLRRIDFDSSAALLKTIMGHSRTIHAMESWDELELRLGRDRRCYALFHPSMPEEPLVFIEVALTLSIARHILPLTKRALASSSPSPSEATTAIFYAIVSTQPGLSGIDLGHLLIKRVVKELVAELPRALLLPPLPSLLVLTSMVELHTFSTLSPVPNFRAWLTSELELSASAETAGSDKFKRSDLFDSEERRQLETRFGQSGEPLERSLLVPLSPAPSSRLILTLSIARACRGVRLE